jgi:hypothetical protein
VLMYIPSRVLQTTRIHYTIYIYHCAIYCSRANRISENYGMISCRELWDKIPSFCAALVLLFVHTASASPDNGGMLINSSPIYNSTIVLCDMLGFVVINFSFL